MTKLKTSEGSSLLDLRLFLGFACDASFEQELVKTNPHLIALFTGGGDYLTRLSHQGVTYLGKETSPSLTLTEMGRLEAHILSLLRRLTPSYPFDNQSLVIFGF